MSASTNLPRVKYADVFGAKWRARFDELKALPVGTMFRACGLKFELLAVHAGEEGDHPMALWLRAIRGTKAENHMCKPGDSLIFRTCILGKPKYAGEG